MAVTTFSKGFKMTAVNDSLNQASVGHAGASTASRYLVRVNSIQFVAGGGTPTRTTLAADGGSGPVIFDGVPTANDTSQIQFSQPQDIADLTCTLYGGAGLSQIIVHCT